MKKGLIELATLAALRRGEAYGYQLLQTLARAGPLATTESTLYPTLARLAEERLIAVRIAPSPAGPPRRYYRLTEKGRLHLAGWSDYWTHLSRAVDAMLAADGPAPKERP